MQRIENAGVRVRHGDEHLSLHSNIAVHEHLVGLIGIRNETIMLARGSMIAISEALDNI